MHNQDLDGRPLRVEMARPDYRRESEKQETNNIFIANIPSDTTEEELQRRFEEFGPGTSQVEKVAWRINRLD